MTRWQFVAATTGGNRLGVLPARARKVTIPLDGPPRAEFVVDGGDDLADQLVEFRADVEVWRDRERLARCRVVSTRDLVTPQGHEVPVVALGYGALLDARQVTLAAADLTFLATDLAELGWWLINDTQTRDNGDLGITRGTTTYGTAVDRTIPAGLTIAGALDRVATEQGGHWWIDDDLVWRIGGRGVTRSEPLVWGGAIVDAERTPDPSRVANLVRQSGADGTTPVLLAHDDIATDPRGRIERQRGDVAAATDDQVADAAAAALAEGVDGSPSWAVTLAPGWWRPGRLDVGDTVRLVVRTGRLDVDETITVRQLEIVVDDDDTETVKAVLGAPPLDAIVRARTVERRLTDLERR